MAFRVSAAMFSVGGGRRVYRLGKEGGDSKEFLSVETFYSISRLSTAAIFDLYVDKFIPFPPKMRKFTNNKNHRRILDLSLALAPFSSLSRRCEQWVLMALKSY